MIGVLGFYKNGITKASRYDGDAPLLECDTELMTHKFNSIIMVNPEDSVSSSWVKYYKAFGIYVNNNPTWGELLARTRGSLKAWDNDFVIHMLNDWDVIYDSLDCKYAFILNLDTMNLEKYSGENVEPTKEGRYHSKKPYRTFDGTDWYACRLDSAERWGTGGQ